MTLPSSTVVAIGGVDEAGADVDGGKTMTNPRRPLFEEMSVFLRYFSVWETETWALALRSKETFLEEGWCRRLRG